MLRDQRAAQPACAAPAAAPLPRALPPTATAVDRAPPTRRSHEATQATETPPPPLRVHVEEAAQGLVVWLGLDAAAAAQGLRAQAIATELRRSLAASGQRLAAVICNGSLLASAATPPSTHDKEL
jgi:hypothetical protein